MPVPPGIVCVFSVPETTKLSPIVTVAPLLAIVLPEKLISPVGLDPISLYDDPSFVYCHLSVVSFHLILTFVLVPRSTSIPAF